NRCFFYRTLIIMLHSLDCSIQLRNRTRLHSNYRSLQRIHQNRKYVKSNELRDVGLVVSDEIARMFFALAERTGVER
ncbi:hypothetical protein PFISCL1PPCAC_4441, partial [Pristionchus fissidentatus]